MNTLKNVLKNKYFWWIHLYNAIGSRERVIKLYVDIIVCEGGTLSIVRGYFKIVFKMYSLDCSLVHLYFKGAHVLVLIRIQGWCYLPLPKLPVRYCRCLKLFVLHSTCSKGDQSPGVKYFPFENIYTQIQVLITAWVQ